MQFKALSCIQRPNIAKFIASTSFVWWKIKGQFQDRFSHQQHIPEHEILQVRSFYVLPRWHQRVNMSRQSMCSQSGVCLQGWSVWTLEMSWSRSMIMYLLFKVMIASLNHMKGRILGRHFYSNSTPFSTQLDIPLKTCHFLISNSPNVPNLGNFVSLSAMSRKNIKYLYVYLYTHTQCKNKVILQH